MTEGSASRARILASIRQGLGRGRLGLNESAALEQRIAAARPNTVPARAQLPDPARQALFTAEAQRLGCTVERLPDLAAVPAAVAAFLSHLNLAPAVRASPDLAQAGIPWAERPLLSVSYGRAQNDDETGVTSCFAGIAETGTLMLLSSGESPATLNFMPDNHIVILKAGDVVGSMEEAFARLRARAGATPPGNPTAGAFMPRTVNLISGASRTADIDGQLVMGAHGPRRLHVLLVSAG